MFSRYLATCSADTTVKIWSISPNYEFKLEKILQGHQRWVWDCAFSADSAYLVTGAFISFVVRTGVTGNFSFLGPHCAAVGDGFWRDRAAIQWSSQRFQNLTSNVRRHIDLASHSCCLLRSA